MSRESCGVFFFSSFLEAFFFQDLMLDCNCIYLSSCPFSISAWLLYSEPVPQRKNTFPPLSLLLLSGLILFFYMEVIVPRAARRIFSFTQMRNSCCSEYEMGTGGEGSDVTGGDSANPACSTGCLNMDLGHSEWFGME